MNKREELAKIAKEIENCKLCKMGKTGKAVPGEGRSDAAIVFVGEAPGRTEAKTGRPFVGRSGQFLRSLIRNVGFDETEVYITSPVKYLPKRGTPSSSDIRHGKTHLETQIQIIDPKVVVLLGGVAAKAVLEKPVSVLKMHGSVFKERDRTIFITLHPAAALRFPFAKKVMEKDFGKLKKLLIKFRV